MTDDAYVRGAGATISRAALRRIVVWTTGLTLAVLVVVLAVQAHSDNDRLSRLRSGGVTVRATIVSCYGVLTGTGITHLGFTCTGRFSLTGHTYTERFAGSEQYHLAGQQPELVVAPNDPGNVKLSGTVAASKPSWSAYTGAAAVGAALLALLAWTGWSARRNRGRSSAQPGPSAAPSTLGSRNDRPARDNPQPEEVD